MTDSSQSASRGGWFRVGEYLYGPWRQWPTGGWVRDIIQPNGLIAQEMR